MSRLQHENVVRYLTVEKDATAVYLVTELISGGTLFDYIRQEFDQNRMLLDIANRMKYSHEQNIVHGDLTSHNILLRENIRPAVICEFWLIQSIDYCSES